MMPSATHRSHVAGDIITSAAPASRDTKAGVRAVSIRSHLRVVIQCD
jgi:hypothetical protein